MRLGYLLPGATLPCTAVREGRFRRPTANLFEVLNWIGRVQTAGGFFISEAKAVESKFSCAHGLASTGDSDSVPVCIVVY